MHVAYGRARPQHSGCHVYAGADGGRRRIEIERLRWKWTGRWWKPGAPKWREVLRGVLKTSIGMLPAEGGQGVVVRARFDDTVWDSNGDARTKTVLARDEYDAFFGKVGEALNSALTPRQP
ncbi:hypothetical protein GNZ12_39180 [Paraburkholderia sp. 1N]|uniref:Uncharacterized protein n=1 Tax=Paraburkholderia solitsugae TaxID=2675748 RepID=A0ABX2C2F4_9BURK|nr:hypothetical protein [Paraburkholderia solitsugae]NPT47211.1 hypothetical protein [Paraburkholderia solitsugae]